ncbi:hypothetical protein T4D_14306 [Trichinella pseudospiralis]|uniref:Uncharacterized protein n=1 Tax=Trichinella pseudospiralis TaxID=6337 RepID=A0A0V1FVF6_TRIPS|nr:hypothetical protein T4D_14306 [Trichinella pseudospiralis]
MKRFVYHYHQALACARQPVQRRLMMSKRNHLTMAGEDSTDESNMSRIHMDEGRQPVQRVNTAFKTVR